MVGPQFWLTLLTTWQILLKGKNPKAEKLAKKAFDSKREKSQVKTGSANFRSNHASFSHVSISRLGADDIVKSFRLQPFQFRQATFLPRSQFRRGTEPASLVDWKDTGATTAPISFLQEDQISQPSDVFDFEKSSVSCLFKVGSLREHVDFWSNSIRTSDFIIIVEGYRIPFFDLPEYFVISNRCSAFKFKDFVNEAISQLTECGCVKEVLNPPKLINPLHVGIIVRARARWHEHGERSTKYFLTLEKRNHVKNTSENW